MAERLSTVRLEWVVHDGRDVHVSTFAGLPPSARPEVRCPACGGVLVLKLGEKRAWHAAHKEATACGLADPAAALHHNTRMALAEKLRGVDAIEVEEACVGPGEAIGGTAGACPRRRVRPWRAGWTAVEAKRTLHTRRPDIRLVKDGGVVGLVEVRGPGGFEADKTPAGWEAPWIEVAAEGPRAVGDWRPGTPLPVLRVGPGEPYRCARCRDLAHRGARGRIRESGRGERVHRPTGAVERARREAREVARRFRSEASTLRTRMRSGGVEFIRLLLFDRFDPDATVRRDGMVVGRVFRDGVLLEAFVGILGEAEVLETVGARAGKAGYERLRRAAETRLAALRAGGIPVDVAPRWIRPWDRLNDAAFVADWQDQGLRWRWPVPIAERPSPWRVAWTVGEVDGLDLLRYLFGRYLAGLPVRRLWSRRTGRWFQPAVLAELPWRLDPPGTEPPTRR